jgi:hypothetical protein
MNKYSMSFFPLSTNLMNNPNHDNLYGYGDFSHAHIVPHQYFGSIEM